MLVAGCRDCRGDPAPGPRDRYGVADGGQCGAGVFSCLRNKQRASLGVTVRARSAHVLYGITQDKHLSVEYLTVATRATEGNA